MVEQGHFRSFPTWPKYKESISCLISDDQQTHLRTVISLADTILHPDPGMRTIRLSSMKGLVKIMGQSSGGWQNGLGVSGG